MKRSPASFLRSWRTPLIVAAVVLGVGFAWLGRRVLDDGPERTSALDVSPLAFEAKGPGRNIDDPCFWADERDPAQSLLFVTAKDSQLVEVFNAATGARVTELAGFDRPNNCTVDGDLLLVTDVAASDVKVRHLPDFARLGTFGNDMDSPQGIDVLTTPDGRHLVYVSDSSDASVHVYDLATRERVREFSTGFGEGIEPILVDDQHQRIFVARGEKDEKRGVGMFTPEGTLVREFGGAIFSAVTEGLGIYACGEGGYLLSAQQNRSGTEIEVFDRVSLMHLGTFRLRNADGKATGATDGIALLQAPVPGFGSGLLAVCDGGGSTPRDEMDVVGWDRVAAVMGLARCPGGGVPDCETAPCTRRIVAAADSYVTNEAPLTNFGSAPMLEVERHPSRGSQAFLRFEVPELAGFDVVGVRLRLTADRSAGAESQGGGQLFRTTDNWTENEVTFAKKPGTLGSLLAVAGWVRRDEPIDLDVTEAVKGAGTYNFILLPASKDRVRYRSREAADSPPTLLVELRARAGQVAASAANARPETAAPARRDAAMPDPSGAACDTVDKANVSDPPAAASDEVVKANVADPAGAASAEVVKTSASEPAVRP